MDEAAARLRRFAAPHGWEGLLEKPLVTQIEIYSSKDAWDQRLYTLNPTMAGTPIPPTFVGGAEQGILMLCSPEAAKLSSEEYVKLIVHELAHVLHTRIVDGREEEMGPVWFWEGFAVYASNQYMDEPVASSEAEIWAVVNAEERGSYRKYGAVFRHFLGKTTLPEFVRRARSAGFVEWLKR